MSWSTTWAAVLGVTATAWGLTQAHQRLQLSMAKQPGLTGHLRWAKRMARWVPSYAFDDLQWMNVDDAPPAVRQQRRESLLALSHALQTGSPQSLALTAEARHHIADLQLIHRYRIPYPFVPAVMPKLPISSFIDHSDGVWITDLDGQRYLDVTGSYGVNLMGHDFYQSCMNEAHAMAASSGVVLGSYLPWVNDNAKRLCALSGMDEVSFHMSGTEAVMQAVRMARYTTGRRKVVRFSGAYHGWWDDVQPGPGNPMPPSDDTLTLKELSERTLAVLKRRNDIACVLVNPLQALHPNRSAPADTALVGVRQAPALDRKAYTEWLQALQVVCRQRGIALILDEVFMGFRLGVGGAQAYFGIEADLVTYGKTLGGGLPVGVVCGRTPWMKRYREDRPADLCFARGTFNAHPQVMAAMNVFLRRLDDPELADRLRNSTTLWNQRLAALNAKLAHHGFPLHMDGLETVWTLHHLAPSRFNWMLQFFLRQAGIALSWTGTGRFIFSLNFGDAEFEEFAERFMAACQAMQAGGWWWHPPGQTERGLRRALLKEMVRAKLGLKPNRAL